MADHTFGLMALAVLPQSAAGTVNPTIAGLTTSVNTAQGLLVGVGDTGEGNSGIDLPEHSSEEIASARVGNSATAGTFVREIAEGLAITVPLGGARNTASNPTVDGDFDWSQSTIWPGMDAVFKATGLTGAADPSGTKGHIYKVTSDVTYASVALWAGGLLAIYKDCLCKITDTFEAGTIGRRKVEFTVGSVHSWATQALSTITAGNQSVTCPVVKGVGNSYGSTRPFSTCEVTLEPEFETFGDSNETISGKRVVIAGVNVDVSMQIYAATADPDMEHDRLVLLTAPTTSMTFQVGDTTVGGGVAKAYSVALHNMRPKPIQMVRIGSFLGWDVTAKALAISSEGTEYAFEAL